MTTRYDDMVAEYAAITAHLIENEMGYETLGGRQLAVPREIIEELLDRNKYETAAAKLAAWKSLRWIVTDEKQITRPVYFREEKASRRMVVIDVDVYNTMKNLSSKPSATAGQQQ
jgi:hypothetical protein